MDKKTIISLIIIIVGVTSLVLWSKSIDSKELSVKESNQVVVKGTLVLSEPFYDFGTISMKDGNVSKVLQVTNTGTEDVKLSSLSTSCMCTNAYFITKDGIKRGPFGMVGHGGATRISDVIKAGDSADIEVVYDPNAHGPAGVGLIERAVALEDENGDRVEFLFKVNVTP